MLPNRSGFALEGMETDPTRGTGGSENKRRGCISEQLTKWQTVVAWVGPKLVSNCG
jgi:hypothetical protein